MEQFEDDMCTGISECAAMKRIEFVMSLYDEHREKATMQTYASLLIDSLGDDYGCIKLLSDYQHLRREHGADSELKQNSKCSRSDCATVDEQDVMESLRDDERQVLEISSKVHWFLNHKEQTLDEDDQTEHQRDSLYQKTKIRALNWRKKQDAADKPQTQISKFVMEMESAQTTEIKAGHIDELREMLVIRMPETEVDAILFGLAANHFDSDAILCDLGEDDVGNDQYNDYEQSRLFPLLQSSKQLAKTVIAHFGGRRRDDALIGEFQFGFSRFYYWTHWKESPEHNEAKYQSLKEECLNNQIFSIPISKFHQFTMKAYMYAKSKEGRLLFAGDFGPNNQDYEMPAHLPITSAHIFVLLTYCNHSELQYNYKKYGCRASQHMRSFEDAEFKLFKQRNSEIGHWYKLLFEAVQFFGDKVGPKDVFYTGLNVRLLFTTFSPHFKCPFSTTVDRMKALEFSQLKGVVLKMMGWVGCFDRYFNVEWLSDYDEERERLFFEAQRLQIMDVQYFDRQLDVFENDAYLRAFTLFSCLFEGHFVNVFWKQKQRKKAQKLLITLIRTYKEQNGIAVAENGSIAFGIPIYPQMLFFNVLRRFKDSKTSGEKMYLIKSEYLTLSTEMQNELIDYDAFDSAIAKIKGSSEASDLISKLQIVLQNIFDETYRNLSHNEWTRAIFSNTRAIEMLQAMGFMYIEGQSELVCFTEPPVERVQDVLRSLKRCLESHETSIALRPFLGALCVDHKVEYMDEAEWMIAGNQMIVLRPSHEHFEYSPSFSTKIAAFKLGLRRGSQGSQCTVFQFRVDTILTGQAAVSGKFSLQIGEAKWYRNGLSFRNLKVWPDSANVFCFDDALLDQLDAVTIRFAVCLY